jgi:glycosyltransferase involved in cell wall biosynthesis
MTEPRVGVIVPCFNQGRFASECVASLHAQSYPNWHAVIVDDASTDDSLEQLRRLESDRVKVVHLHRNLGRALIRNEAVRQLGGGDDYILNVDCDDRLTPGYIAKLAGALQSDPHAGLAYGTLVFFGAAHPTGETSWPSKPFDSARRYLENVIPGPGVLFRAQALRATEMWRATFTHSSAEDWDIWLQVVERGWGAVWVRDAIYEYRQHAASFLARSSEETQVDQEINILRHHAGGIRKSCGLDAFLSPRVIPSLASAIRQFRMARAASIAVPLIRRAPAAAMALVARHYARRLRAMLSR